MPTSIAAATLAALVLGLPAGARSNDAGPFRPTLVLRATTPLAIVGRGFGENERVQLVAATSGVRQVRTGVASKNGHLRVRFTLRVRRCADLTVRAVGSLGSRAVLRRVGACDVD